MAKKTLPSRLRASRTGTESSTGTRFAADITEPQRATLKAAIEADPTLNAYPLTYPAGATALASALNALAVPTFTVWKTRVNKDDVGQTIQATAFAAITAGNNDKLSSFAQWNSYVNPSRADHRAFFEDIFSVAAGATTRTALTALWKRPATVIEKIFAVGTGSDASPATLTYEGAIDPADAHNARQ
jgi:hypothetical protein